MNVFEFGSKLFNTFDYYIKDSIKVKLSSFLMKLNGLDGMGWLWEKHLSYIPVFKDKNEMNEVKSFINRNPEKAKKDVYRYKEEVIIAGYNTKLNDEEYEFVKRELATNLLVIEKIKEYRVLYS